MADPVSEKRHAEHMAVRFLLGTLYEMVLMGKDDPVGECDKLTKAILAGFETALTAPGKAVTSEYFSHVALHEMETFWTEVRRGLASRVASRPA